MPQSIKQKYLEYLNSEIGYKIYNRFKIFLYGKEDSLVEKIYREIFFPLVSKSREKTVKICDIGGGDGKRMQALLLKAHQDFPELCFELFFIEPSEYAFRRAEKKFTRLKNFSKVMSQNSTFEKAHLPEGFFDVVLLIHSIFTFSSAKNIVKVQNLKNKNGKVIVVANEAGSLLSSVNAEARKNLSGSRYEIRDFLKDLKILRVKHTSTKYVTEFFVSRRRFSEFKKILVTWTNLGQPQKHAYGWGNFLQKLATKENSEGYFYKETEVFIMF